MQQRSSIRILAGLLWVVLYSLTMVQGLINLHIAATRDSQSSQCLDSFSKLPHAVGQSADTASRTLLQHAPAPAPLGLLGLSATGNAQVLPRRQQILCSNLVSGICSPDHTWVAADSSENHLAGHLPFCRPFQSSISGLLQSQCCKESQLYLVSPQPFRTLSWCAGAKTAFVLLQVLIGNSLQYVFPPNTTLVSTDMQEQINDDTVTVACSFVIWQSMIPILLANRCCALEVLYLQHAVERVMPEAIGTAVHLVICLAKMLHILTVYAISQQPQ